MAIRTGRREYQDYAIQIIQRLAQQPSPPVEALVAWGVIQQTEGDIEEAEAAYRRALQLRDDLVVAQNNLVMILARRGQNLSEAIKVAEAAIRTSPRNANFHDTLAFVQAKAGASNRPSPA